MMGRPLSLPLQILDLLRPPRRCPCSARLFLPAGALTFLAQSLCFSPLPLLPQHLDQLEGAFLLDPEPSCVVAAGIRNRRHGLGRGILGGQLRHWPSAKVLKSRRRCEYRVNGALRSSSDALWLNASNHAARPGVCNRKVRTNDHQADCRRGCPGRGCAHHSGVCLTACGSGLDVDRGARRPTSSHAWTSALPSSLSALPRGLPRLLA